LTHTIPSIAEALSATGVTFFERGWLSANNMLIQGDGPTALIDTGYWTHGAQTSALIEQALDTRNLDLLLNTHLHSDHCGGNAALQNIFPQAITHIPPGQAQDVLKWDPVALTYTPTGQHCPRFQFDALLVPGTSLRLGSHDWEIHAAKGHDPHSIVLFQPTHRLLISADALWENGFGVVFPELEGISAFHEVEETLDLIEQLAPLTVIPGHGPIFQDVSGSLRRARAKLDYFIKNPAKHHRHGLKVLIKYKLLEWQTVELDELLAWGFKTDYLRNAMPSKGRDRASGEAWLTSLLSELTLSKALVIDGQMVRNV